MEKDIKTNNRFFTFNTRQGEIRPREVTVDITEVCALENTSTGTTVEMKSGIHYDAVVGYASFCQLWKEYHLGTYDETASAKDYKHPFMP